MLRIFNKKPKIDAQNQSFLSRLPPEILEAELPRYLELRDIAKLLRTCKHLKDVFEKRLVICGNKKIPLGEYLRVVGSIKDSLTKMTFPEDFHDIAARYIYSCGRSDICGFVMRMLGDYCGHQPYALRSAGGERTARFFSGHWNNSHNNTVQQVLNTYDSGTALDYDYFDAEKLLKTLETKLLEAKRVLKPDGDLVKRIAFVQGSLHVYSPPINLENLCLQLSAPMLAAQEEHHLTKLPAEILQKEIPRHLQLSDLARLLMTCKQLKGTFEKRLVICENKKIPFGEYLRVVGSIKNSLANMTFPNNFYEIANKYFTSDYLNLSRVHSGFVIRILGDYCGHRPYYLKGWEPSARFLSGHWNNSHSKTVQKVLNVYDPHGLNDEHFEGRELLLDLQKELLEAKIVLKLDSDLLKRIVFIQRHLFSRGDGYELQLPELEPEPEPINLVSLCFQLSASVLGLQEEKEEIASDAMRLKL
jgi:hypothetical protein